jgi:hypothetical protein
VQPALLPSPSHSPPSPCPARNIISLPTREDRRDRGVSLVRQWRDAWRSWIHLVLVLVLVLFRDSFCLRRSRTPSLLLSFPFACAGG